MAAIQPVTDDSALPFRKDIEGMRAIAVLLVVAAHAGVPWLQGGYIGVDVFFVISGYLITGLLVAERERDGRIDLSLFFGRRLLRLFPALLAMVVVTSLAASLLLAPYEHRSQSAGALGAVTWTSNILFALENVGYFDAGSQDNLFLHTWSLGVEEQFYLAWPLVVLLAARLSARGTRGGRLDMLATFAMIGILSLVACLLLTAQAPKLAFYMVFARAWQFALGACAWLLLSIASARPGYERWTSGRHVPAAAAIALAVIAASAAVYGDDVPYPGWRALLPSLATAVLLACGASSAANPTVRLLSSKPLVAIGGLSYAWYLWHWPAMVLARGVDGASSPWTGAAAAVLSLALAWATKRWLEDPARRSLRHRPRLVFSGSVVGMAAVAVLVLGWRAAADDWRSSPAQQRYADARQDGAIIYAFDCDQGNRSWRVSLCEVGVDSPDPPIVLLGDSIAMQWLPAVVARHPGQRIVAVTKSACPMVDVPYHYARIGRRYVECELWRNLAIGAVAQLRPAVVYVGSGSAYPFDAEQWRAGSARLLQPLVDAAKETYLLEPAPTLGFDGPRCLARAAWRPWMPQRADACVTAMDPARAEVIEALRAAAGRTGARPVDLQDIACPRGTCAAQRDGRVIYRDGVHLADSYVRSQARSFAAAIEHAHGQ